MTQKTTKRVKVVLARKLRENQTKAENVLLWLLRRKNFGCKFRRQHVIKGFVLDFYCPSARLGIEIDGGIHLKKKDYDKERQEVIETQGIKIIRFKNAQVFYDPQLVIQKIQNNLQKPLNSALSIPNGEGGPRANPDYIGMSRGVGEV